MPTNPLPSLQPMPFLHFAMMYAAIRDRVLTFCAVFTPSILLAVQCLTRRRTIPRLGFILSNLLKKEGAIQSTSPTCSLLLQLPPAR